MCRKSYEGVPRPQGALFFGGSIATAELLAGPALGIADVVEPPMLSTIR